MPEVEVKSVSLMGEFAHSVHQGNLFELSRPADRHVVIVERVTLAPDMTAIQVGNLGYPLAWKSREFISPGDRLIIEGGLDPSRAQIFVGHADSPVAGENLAIYPEPEHPEY